MCCRYYIDLASPELQSIGEAAANSRLMERFRNVSAQGIHTSGEIAPSMIVPVIAFNKLGEQACFPMQWGYQLDNKKLLANARAETASEKPMFRDGWKNHRCVIPASFYYEWEHFLSPHGKKETGEKYLLQQKGARVTWLCGLYRVEQGLPHFVILTRAPDEEIARIHDRMPLIVEERDVERWINPSINADEVANGAVLDVCYQKADSKANRTVEEK